MAGDEQDILEGLYLGGIEELDPYVGGVLEGAFFPLALLPHH